jgi:cell division protein FtsL
VRTGAYVGKGEILGLAKLFSDELTLENMSRLFLYLCSLECAFSLHIS